MSKKLTRNQIESVAGLSSREAAERLGVGKSTINTARADLRDGNLDAFKEESITIDIVGDKVPANAEEIEAALAARGIDRTKHDVSYGFSEWGKDGDVSKSFRVNAAPKRYGGGSGAVEVSRAAPVEVKVPTFTAAPLVGQWKTAIATADHQVGWNKDEPFHDDAAISIATQIIAMEQPEQIIYCGDFMDLPTLGKYDQENGFQGQLQRSFNRGHEILAVDKAVSPNSKQVLIEGNHDKRMDRFVNRNAPEVQGLKRANSEDKYPVMSLPYILAVEELDVIFIDAYPAGMWWINDKLRAIHGTKVNSKGSTAAMYLNEMPHVSVVFGHTHRREIVSHTTYDRFGPIASSAINPGAMCRIDGGVPSVKGAVSVTGENAYVTEDWQQGLAVIRYKDSGEFRTELVEISDGMAIYDRQEIFGS